MYIITIPVKFEALMRRTYSELSGTLLILSAEVCMD